MMFESQYSYVTIPLVIKFLPLFVLHFLQLRYRRGTRLTLFFNTNLDFIHHRLVDKSLFIQNVFVKLFFWLLPLHRFTLLVTSVGRYFCVQLVVAVNFLVFRLLSPPAVSSLKFRMASPSVVMRKVRRYCHTPLGKTSSSSAVGWTRDVFYTCDLTVIDFRCVMRLTWLETRPYLICSDGATIGA